MLSMLIGLMLTKQESWQRSAQARLIYISALYQNATNRKNAMAPIVLGVHEGSA